MALFGVGLLISIIWITYLEAICDTVYTLGDDELCTVSLDTFQEECITFNASYNIAASNGIAINPATNDMYIVVSIGSGQGDRELCIVNSDYSLTTITTYTSNADKLAGITYTCSGNVISIYSYNIHSFFK